MSNKRRFVFDTNTIISAFLFYQSTPSEALRVALEVGEVLVSIEVLEEMAEVLHREKLDRYLERKIREEFLKALVKQAVVIETRARIQMCRDQKDDKFLELALSGGAECIVSGDADLLVMNPFRGISILTPAEFLSKVSQK